MRKTERKWGDRVRLICDKCNRKRHSEYKKRKYAEDPLFYHKEYLKRIAKNPELGKENYERCLKNNPDYNKEHYERRIAKNPDRGKENYEKYRSHYIAYSKKYKKGMK